MNHQLPSPALNISAGYIGTVFSSDWPEPPFGGNWTDPQTNQQPFDNTSILRVVAEDNSTYTFDYILANGTCTPQDVSGFSSPPLSDG